MKQTVKFDIYLGTYNRPVLLEYTLQSLCNQTYKNFIVHLVDHGSTPPVNVDKLPKDLDIRFTRYENNFVDQHGCDIQEKVLGQLEGTHFINFCDDDILLPNALEIAANIIYYNPSVDNLSLGNVRFNHDTKKPERSSRELSDFDKNITIFDSQKAGVAFCSSWGIGPEVNFYTPLNAHSSASICSNDLLLKTKNYQGNIFVKPFGDVGFVGTLFHTKHGYFLNSPLGIIGYSRNQVSNMSVNYNRFKWEREIPFLQYSPLKACTFKNMGVESHLKVIYGNKLDKAWDISLRPHFFTAHLEEILSDDPWTEQTENDIEEAVPQFEESLMRYMNLTSNVAKLSVNDWIKKCKDMIVEKKKEDSDLPKKNEDTVLFNNVLDYSDYLMQNYWER